MGNLKTQRMQSVMLHKATEPESWLWLQQAQKWTESDHKHSQSNRKSFSEGIKWIINLYTEVSHAVILSNWNT